MTTSPVVWSIRRRSALASCSTRRVRRNGRLGYRCQHQRQCRRRWARPGDNSPTSPTAMTSGFQLGRRRYRVLAVATTARPLQGRDQQHQRHADGTLIFTVQLNQGARHLYGDMTGDDRQRCGRTFSDLDQFRRCRQRRFPRRWRGRSGTPVDLLLSASGIRWVAASVDTNSDSIGAGNQSIGPGRNGSHRLRHEPEATGNPRLPSGFVTLVMSAPNSLLQTIPTGPGRARRETSHSGSMRWIPTTRRPTSRIAIRRGGFGNSTHCRNHHECHRRSASKSAKLRSPVRSIGAVGVWTTSRLWRLRAAGSADGSVTFTGIQQGDQYGISTGANDFNAVAVTALPARSDQWHVDIDQTSFDSGMFSIGRSIPAIRST